MYKNIILGALLLVLPCISFGESGEREALVKKVITASGMEATINSIPEQLLAQATQRKPVSKTPERDEVVTQILVSSFDATRSYQVLYDSVNKNLSQAHLNNIASWLETPLGKRFTAAETQASSPAGQAEMIRYMADIQSKPPADDRIALIQKFEQSAHQTDYVIRIFEHIMRGMLTSINEFAEQDKKVPMSEIETQIQQIKPVMKQMMWQQMLLMSHYIYQSFSNQEIEQYIAFLETDSGSQYLEVGVNGFSEVFIDFMKSAIPAIKAAAEKQNMTTS